MIFKTFQGESFTEYLDFESIEATDHGTLKVEEIQDFTEDHSSASGKHFRSLRITAEYSPSQNGRRVLEKVACTENMGGGEVAMVDRTQGAWTRIEHESNHDEKLKALQHAKKLGYW
ncbi:MAG: hypothetical protein RL133_291 [Pseudomonadota bacterium]|jgi:hypothetical protein